MSIAEHCEACQAYQLEHAGTYCEDHKKRPLEISTLDFKRTLAVWKNRIKNEDGMALDQYNDQEMERATA